MNIQSTPSKRQKNRLRSKPPTQQRPSWFIWAVLIVAMAGTFHEFVIQREDGSYELRKERQAKQDREIEDLQAEEAEQYALRAKVSGYYPCYNCGDADEVFLNIGEIWKYGYTTRENRYTKKYLDRLNLIYDKQFMGTPVECQIEEKRKIYQYPLLPENLIRSFKLPRPLGNKQDN
jgi:hypothetical protein